MLYNRALAALALAAVTSTPASAAPPIPVQGISQYLFDRLVHFTKVAMATYVGDNCTISNLPRLATFSDTTLDVYGWVLRDDATREIIIAFRGTNSDINHVADKNRTLAPLGATAPKCEDCAVEGGYYLDFLAVSDQVDSLVSKAMKEYPHYGLVITGHSLGASLASICSAHLRPKYDNLTVYTYGEPRTGNLAYAQYLDKHFKTCFLEHTEYFRVTHEDDSIVQKPFLNQSFVHQGLELWLPADPATPTTTWVCPSEGFCNEAFNDPTGINAAHLTYFNVTFDTCSLTA